MTDQPPPSRAATVLAFATLYLVWGSTYLAIRVSVATMPPFGMASVRFIIAGALLLGFLLWRGGPRPTGRQWLINTVIGTFLLLGGNGLVVWAEQYIVSSVVALLLGATPLFFVLTEWFWPGGSRPRAATFSVLLLGFAGVAWLAAPWESESAGGYHPGAMLALLGACVFWSIGSIYSRHAKHGADPFTASALQMLGGGAVIGVVALGHGDFARFDPAAVSVRSWIAFVYLVFVGSLAGFSAFVWLMKHCPPAKVATYAYVNPVVAVLLGWLILDEPVGPRTLAASAVILTAVAIITVQKNRAPGK
jgi:drug/metabolite transporter (DMT)-like permease